MVAQSAVTEIDSGSKDNLFPFSYFRLFRKFYTLHIQNGLFKKAVFHRQLVSFQQICQLPFLFRPNAIALQFHNHGSFFLFMPQQNPLFEPWQYLTIKQAAADHHAIIQTLKAKLYPRSKWVTTGISKGGQTTIFHRYFYPEDADVSVPYVAPLNLKEVDPRIERFLNKAMP